MTRTHAHTRRPITSWKAGEPETWLLVSNLETPEEAHSTNQRRMWSEEMLSDFKKHGLDLHGSHLGHFLRLSPLTLPVAFIYYMWLVALGSRIIKCGQRRLVDWADRRDLSTFRIGLQAVERWLANKHPLLIPPALHFS